MTVSLAGWIATGPKSGVHILSAPGSKIQISAPVIWNFTGDGVKVEDPLAFVTISAGTLIHDNGGYGVNATSPTDKISPGAEPLSNASGAYAPNTHVENLNPNSGYKKYSNGQIHQWGVVNFTGAANTILAPSEGYPINFLIPFPNATIASSIVTSPYGFANGASLMSSTASPFGKSGLYINMISNGNIVNPQSVHYEVWGY